MRHAKVFQKASFLGVARSCEDLGTCCLGQLHGGNLLLSLVLMPLAPVGVMIGHALVKRTDPTVYYRIISFFLVIVGLRLLAVGLA